MGNNVVPRQQGDHYQALFFWCEASKLLYTTTDVERVLWESDNTGGFDDVVVHYADPGRRDKEELIKRDYYQVKFHVSQAKAITWQSLMDPNFIGATEATILSRLKDAYDSDPQGYRQSRFVIINIWGLDMAGLLPELIGLGGRLKLETLFDGTTDRSKYGKIRKAWREYLGLTSNEELKKIVTPLRIRYGHHDFEGLHDMLTDKFQLAKLKPIEADKRNLSGYVELIQRLHAAGKKEFTKVELQQICEEEGFVLKEGSSEDVHLIGIRSFYRGAEDLHQEVHDLLCLLDKFSGRFLRESTSWPQVYEEVQALAAKAIAIKKPVRLHLDTHLALAFGFGYCLDSKAAVPVTIVQKTAHGKLRWSVDLQSLKDQPAGNWSFETHPMDDTGNDLTVCISATHNILNDVLQFEQSQVPKPGKVLSAVINPVPSGAAFKNGNHIYVAVQELVAKIREQKQSMKPGATVRVFMSGPVAFAFFFGQFARSLGKIALFEYDFEQLHDGSYHAAISLPIIKQ